ncbi:hypothetical protein [Moraxella cuniculi]|nr:hypothetical protein [Moraxella cuniculi]
MMGYYQKQSGFVLLVVLIVLLFMSVLTTWLINQNAVNTSSAWLNWRQQSLFVSVDTMVQGFWRLSPDELVNEAKSPQTWLNTIITTDDEMVEMTSCDGLLNFGSRQVDIRQNLTGQQSAPCGGDTVITKQWLYAKRLPQTHFLVRQWQAANITLPTAEQPDDTTAQPNTWQYIHVQLFVVAMPANNGRFCQTQPMYQHQAIKCLTDNSVANAASTAEWLMVVQADNSDSEPATDSVLFIKPLRSYDIRLVRE